MSTFWALEVSSNGSRPPYHSKGANLVSDINLTKFFPVFFPVYLKIYDNIKRLSSPSRDFFSEIDNFSFNREGIDRLFLTILFFTLLIQRH